MKRRSKILRVVLATFLAGSALQCVFFIEFLRNGGLQLLSMTTEYDLTVISSDMRETHWSAILATDQGDIHVSLQWGARADSWRDIPISDSDGLMELESGSVRWVSDRFSLHVSQDGRPAGIESPRGFVNELRVGDPVAMTCSERFRAYVSSADYIGMSFDQMVASLSRLSDERWDTIVFGAVFLIVRLTKQVLTSWQIPVIAAIPGGGIPIVAWLWVAALAFTSLALVASNQYAKVFRRLSKRQ